MAGLLIVGELRTVREVSNEKGILYIHRVLGEDMIFEVKAGRRFSEAEFDTGVRVRAAYNHKAPQYGVQYWAIR